MFLLSIGLVICKSLNLLVQPFRLLLEGVQSCVQFPLKNFFVLLILSQRTEIICNPSFIFIIFVLVADEFADISISSSNPNNLPNRPCRNGNFVFTLLSRVYLDHMLVQCLILLTFQQPH